MKRQNTNLREAPQSGRQMDKLGMRDSLTDAIRYWEPRRLVYNAILAAIVLLYFGMNYSASLKSFSLDSALSIFLLAVLANVAYCAAYLVDIFAQMSGYRDTWRNYRWILFSVGVLFAGIITRFLAMAMFQSGSN